MQWKWRSGDARLAAVTTAVQQDPPAASDRPQQGGLRSDSLSRSARRALEPPLDLRQRLLRLAAVVGTFAILAVGWQVTGIDFVTLFTRAGSAQHIFRGLVTPDVVARQVVTTEISASLAIGRDSGETTEGSDGARRLKITPGAVQPGEYVTFEATGFSPGGTGQIRLLGPGSVDLKLQDVVTDSGGALKIPYQGDLFDVSFQWPAGRVPDGEYRAVLRMSSPTGAWVPSDTFILALGKIGETILLALMGTVFGVLISVPMSFFGASNLMKGTVAGEIAYAVVRTVFNLGRSIEVLILAVIMAVIVGIGSFAGVMAIVLHSIGAMGKLYSEAIESIDPGPIEAIRATGASQLQIVLYAVVPQVIPAFLSFTMYRWDINVRMSTVIGLVGGGGIGYLLKQHMDLLQWSQAATSLWLIAIVVISMDYFSAWIRARIV